MPWRIFAVTLLVTAGCTPGGYVGREVVADSVAHRTGYELPPSEVSCDALLPCAWPAEVNPADGLSEDEAATLALWGNPRFQEMLAQLGITWADLVQAGQLTNPQLWAVFPVGPKQLEFSLTFPLEALIQRPRRVAMARIEARRVAQQLAQEALNAILAARQAHADVLWAQDRLDAMRQIVARRSEIIRHAEALQRAGEASQIDVSVAVVFNGRGAADLRRAGQEWELARQRLAVVLGLPVFACPMVVGEALPAVAAAPPLDVPCLIEQTLASRPDLLAAADAVASVEQRARLARYDYILFQPILPDYNQEGEKGDEAGPGVNLTLPIFHQNQGAIARAEAEAEIARRRLATLRATVTQEISQSYGRMVQARDEWLTLGQQVEPRAASAYQAAARAYFDRATTLPILLELARQADETQLRRVDVFNDMRRAAAELERNVGGRLCLPTAAVASRGADPRINRR
jgi:cobalt-zinc-cadmium efflux system outer membrane protein